MTTGAPGDLLALAAELVDIPSVSHHEQALADRLEAELRTAPGLEVVRIDDNVVARTRLGRAQRVVLAGHLDTVPPHGNDRARLDGEVLWGLGSADMKAALAVFVALARAVPEPAVDVTYALYACEEVAHEHSGLGRLLDTRPDLLAGDVAILGEPSGGAVEAGCQGTLRVEALFEGRRAHTARPWKGRNAIHRLAGALARLESYEPRRPVVDGCEYHEAMQAVRVEGGQGNNVVPDRAVLTVNHRFAPDRTPEEALAHVAGVLADADALEVVDLAPAAPPALDHPLLAALLDRHRLTVRAKLGWTDVARFAALGVPAVNLGPGDPGVAHTAEEHVTRADVERAHAVLRDLLERGT
ncbi:MAG: succinyl-diaminopimelate desuccinylase [Acidimicrobiia bacterium]|nr:succinyl-diaminopimelate desuccinylase [Acidimicrobiia bacterium]